MTTEELLDKLEGVHRSGGAAMARCPAHEDSTASLSVKEKDGKILLHCHAGCDTGAVLSALGLGFSDLSPHGVNYAEPEAVYEYTDETGELLFEALRFPGKKFRQRHADPETGETVWTLDGVRRVIYRLPEVLQAVHQDQTVYIAEGEKDVEALRSAGVVATCNPGGAGKWRDEYVGWFSGAKVIIVADRDEVGRTHAEAVKQALEPVAAAVYVVQARKGKDAYDHLIEHELELEEFEVVKTRRVRRGIVTAYELASSALEDLTLRETDIPGYILIPSAPLVWRQGRLYAVGGYTGDGKSSWALQGTRKLSEEHKRGGYFTLEMPERDLRNKLIAHKGVPLKMLEEPWRINLDPAMKKLYEEAVEEMRDWQLDIIFNSSVTADKIVEISRDREYDYIVIDHLHRFGWGNDRRKFEEQVMMLTNLALEQNVMVIALCQLRRFSRGQGFIAYPRPTLQDFRETEMIGQDASMALALWRQRDETGLKYVDGGPTEMIVLKNRHTTGPDDAAGTSRFLHFDSGREMFA